MNILLVEDDKNICEMVYDFLKSENYNVITAIDGKMAIDIFKEHTFDIVLLDLMLPKSSGLEVLKYIRSVSVIPVIIATAKDSDTDKMLYANVDIEAVGRILKNLIDNAIKYGNAGKFLGISLYKKDNHIYIEVEDHGAGISEKDKIHIFTRAYTADRKKGNGLGLAISQELANSMGGSISVVSIPQEKTVFTIRL